MKYINRKKIRIKRNTYKKENTNKTKNTNEKKK